MRKTKTPQDNLPVPSGRGLTNPNKGYTSTRLRTNLKNIQDKGLVIPNKYHGDSRDFLAQRNRMIKENTQEILQNYEKESQEQTQLEFAYLSDYEHSYGVGIDNTTLEKRIHSFEYKNVDKTSSEAPMSREDLNSLTQLIMAISHSEIGEQRIKDWVKNLTRIGQESVEGYAMLGHISPDESNEDINKSWSLVIKAARNLKAAQSLNHEVFVGIAGTNQLRELVPNFAYIHGFFLGSAPYIDSDTKRVLTFANQEKPVVYCLYEAIKGKELSKLAAKSSGKELFQYFLQVIHALRVGWEKCRFTHYDLHCGNIIVRDTNEPNSFVEYKSSKGTTYIKTPGGVPTIIDYGRSYVEVNGEHHGMNGGDSPSGYISFGLFNNKGNCLYDVYKCLGMLCSDAFYGKNFDAFDDLAPLLRYFNPGDDLKEIATTLRGSSFYSLLQPSSGQDLDDFIDLCEKYALAMNWGDIISHKRPKDVFHLSHIELKSRKEMGIVELYDSLKVYTKDRDINEAVELFEKNFDKIFKETHESIADSLIRFGLEVARSKILEFQDISAEMEKILEDSNSPILPNDIEDYATPELLEQCKEYVTSLTEFLNIYDHILKVEEACIYISERNLKSSIVGKLNCLINQLRLLRLRTSGACSSHVEYIGKLARVFEPNSYSGRMKEAVSAMMYSWENEEDLNDYVWYSSLPSTITPLLDNILGKEVFLESL